MAPLADWAGPSQPAASPGATRSTHSLGSGTGLVLNLHEAEAALSASARNLTLMRACYLFENWVPVLGAARENGVLPSFLISARRVPMVATRDAGRVASWSLLEPVLQDNWATAG